MNSSRCNRCGLVNLATSTLCGRCGKTLPVKPLGSSRQPSTRELAGRGFPFFSVLIVIAVIAFAVYMYRSIQNEMVEIKATEANRIATQPKQEAPGLSRTEYDRQRAGQYANAMKQNPDLAAANKRTAEIDKLMKPAANSQPAR